MLSLFDSSNGCSRREFLRIGTLGMSGLSLSHLLAARAAAAETRSPLTDKAVVFVFTYGGPSQFETFDPKMSAPEGIRSLTGETATALPGVTFGGTFPKLAKLADRLAVVRSFAPSPSDANHGIRPVVCKDTFDGNLGSAYASVAGGTHPETGMPTNLMLYPRAVEPTALQGDFGSDRLAAPGVFGAPAAPFVPGGGGAFQRDMNLRLSKDRLDDRRTLLKALDGAQVALDQAQRAGTDSSRDKAFRMLVQGAGDAFDLSKEDPKTVARYDTAPLVRVESLNNKLLHYRNYVEHARSFGKLMLLARRLCERGAGFVTLTTNFVWDMHADDASKNTTIVDGMRHVGGPVDHGLSVFLEDLAARGLSDKVLLVCCGEMGRTPRVNKRGGRDHWGNLGPLLLAGGGLKMGQVIGQSARNGDVPQTDPVEIKNLVSTVMHTLFDVGQLRLVRGVSREVLQMCDAEPVPGLDR
jgi:hypothetical protein